MRILDTTAYLFPYFRRLTYLISGKMAGEVPCATYMALYIISMHIVNSNGRSSSSQHWKLNLSSGTVEQASAEPGNSTTNSSRGHSNSTRNHTYDNSFSQENGGSDHDLLFKEISAEERMMGILSSRVFSNSGGGSDWIVMAESDLKHQNSLMNCSVNSTGHRHCVYRNRNNSSSNVMNGDDKENIATTDFHKRDLNQQKLSKNSKGKKPPALTCGKPANSSQYDHLRGISERHHHIHVAEPEVATVFKGIGKTTDVDIAQLENKLRRARQDIIKKGNPLSEKSSQIYNHIGNFWRIKGDTQKSVECFRKALSILPEDPDVLINLARVLYNLQYLDDAIFLARKSLHHQRAGENSWLQHYTLGEILKSYGHIQEAIAHFRKSVELNPSFQPTRSYLRELTTDPHLSVTHLTLFIILSLVIGVLSFLLLSVESTLSEGSSNGSSSPVSNGLKSQPRHFNRAMAMRSIKLGINPRMCRLRKSHS